MSRGREGFTAVLAAAAGQLGHAEADGAAGGSSLGLRPLLRRRPTEPLRRPLRRVCAPGLPCLPDLDHPSSTVAHALGPVTYWLARGVAHVSGGHRHATHSIAFAAAAGAGAGVRLAGSAGTWSSVVPVVLLAALALAALGVTATVAAGVLAAAAAVYVLGVAGGTLAWLGPAVGLGCLAHIAGDALTEHGVPLLWPLPTGSPSARSTPGPYDRGGLAGWLRLRHRLLEWARACS